MGISRGESASPRNRTVGRDAKGRWLDLWYWTDAYGFKVAAFRGDMVVYGSRERPSLSFELQKGKDLVALQEATPSGVRLDPKILGVSVEPDVVQNRIVEFVSKLALK
jgi:hypothetical protein